MLLVIIVLYNLPLEMCMSTPYIFLTLIILGLHDPSKKIDVFLQLFIDELKILQEIDILIYDIATKYNFQM